MLCFSSSHLYFIISLAAPRERLIEIHKAREAVASSAQKQTERERENTKKQEKGNALKEIKIEK